MALGYLVVALVAAAVAVFALQNPAPTSVRFLAWGVEMVPVSALMLVALAAGMIVVGVPLFIQRWRLRSRNRALQARVESLEAALAKRDEAPRSTTGGR